MNAARSTTSRSSRPRGRRLLLLVALLCTGSPATASDPPIADRLRDIETQVVDVVERTMPSVVRVTTAGRVGTSATGVVFDRSGLVLTAGHVVEGDPRRLSIELPDGRRFRARVVSSVFDGDVDLGVLDVIEPDDEPVDLPWSPLAPADSLERTDWVVVLGHAASIESAADPAPAARIGRVIGLDRAELALDGPIDAGDSGGPVFDLEGRIVGIASRCGHLAWQNLATSIEAIRAWMPHLMDPGTPRPSVEAWNGRTTRRSPAGSRRDPSFLREIGALAAPATTRMVEIRENDRVVCRGTIVDGDRVVTKASQYARHVRTPRLVVRSDGDELEFQATPVAVVPELDLVVLSVPGLSRRHAARPLERSDAVLRAGSMLVLPGDDGTASVAVVARDRDELSSDRTPDDRPFLGVGTSSARDGGLRVDRVVPNSAAALSGLRPGDTIDSVDDRPVRRTRDLVDLLADLEIGDPIRIEGRRGEDGIGFQLVLGIRPDATRRGIPSNTSLGTSRLSSGLGTVHLVDADMPLETIGSPVIDLDGRLVGWLAARRSRTSMVVVPWSTVEDAIDDVAAREPSSVDRRLCGYRVVATADDDGLVRLDAEDAFPDGDALRRERLGADGRTTWGSWTDVDDALEWSVELDRPGRWLVRLVTACPRREAGTPIRVGIGDAIVDGRIEATDAWNDFQPADLGVATIEETGRLVVRVEPRANPRGAVANLLRVELQRLPDAEDDAKDDGMVE
ncbi:MAG: trypsin-like peptidase domain-containing protein [Planctomycetota bacterium]|nr:trypsin-like peptidase domain-containing protein [Planctomycetota bacterium]